MCGTADLSDMRDQRALFRAPMSDIGDIRKHCGPGASELLMFKTSLHRADSLPRSPQ